MIGLLAAIFSQTTHKFISNPMSPPALDGALAVDIALGFHWGPALILSILTVALGIALFPARPADALRHRRASRADRMGSGQGLRSGAARLVAIAWHITNRLQPGRLDIYMRVTFGVIVATVWITLVWTRSLPPCPSSRASSSTNGRSSAS